MGQTIIEAWKKLHSTCVHLVHTCFAQSLLDDISRRKQYYIDILDNYILLNADLQKEKTKTLEAQKEIRLLNDRQKIEDNDGAIAVQVIKERIHEGVFAAQSHALKQRNVELISQNERLKMLLRSHGN